jgi:ADP-ribose pyrophosphatase YjhB (NUDIX family)
VAKLLQGDRIAKLGHITLGCSAILFDPTRQQILLTRRTDNGRWCLPGGRVDPGETVAEACIREMAEETSLEVRVVRLLGVYSNPDFLLEYGDGERCHIVALNFEVEAISGTLSTSNETTEFGFFSAQEIFEMDVMEHHQERIQDAFSPFTGAIVR